MGKEAYKSMDRRHSNGDFDRFFFGKGLDIGCGNACMPGAEPWDIPQGDANMMKGVEPGSYDWVHSSHCLEHLKAPFDALRKWLNIVKKGGFLIVTVPDVELYEHLEFPPSKRNHDHKWAFSMVPRQIERCFWMPEFIDRALLGESYRLHRIQLNDNGFDYNDKSGRDQTASAAGAQAEIEVIIEKT